MRQMFTETSTMPRSISSPCLADAAIALGHQSPSSFNVMSGIPGFALSCATQPPHQADPALLCFMHQSAPPPRTVRPGVICACQPELTAASGLTLTVLPPSSRCLGLGGG
jgi:hypothetical protein